MSNHQFTRPEGTGGKSILGSDDKTPLNQLEKEALGELDQDKLNELANDFEQVKKPTTYSNFKKSRQARKYETK